MAATLLAFIPAVAAMYLPRDDGEIDTFTGYPDPSAMTASTSLSQPTATTSPPVDDHKESSGYRVFDIIIWAVALCCLLLSVGVLLWILWRRHKARSVDPYADTPLPTLDRTGRWGLTTDIGGSRGPGGKKDGRGKWSRLEEESAPLTADLSSPESSPVMHSKKKLYDDDDDDDDKKY